jgi:hypothetical protein
MIKRRRYIPFHSPAVAGAPIVYQKDDMVKTRDGRRGVVVDYKFQDDLIIFKDNEPSRGFFIVTVDHGGYTSQYLRHDLSGKRLGGCFW